MGADNDEMSGYTDEMSKYNRAKPPNSEEMNSYSEEMECYTDAESLNFSEKCENSAKRGFLSGSKKRL